MSSSFPAAYRDTPVSSEDIRTPSHAVHTGGDLQPARGTTPVPCMPKETGRFGRRVSLRWKAQAFPSRILSAEGVPYRYRLESESDKGAPHCRLRRRAHKRRPVCLEFFVGRRQAYRNAVSMHRASQAQRKNVCRCVRQNVAVIDIHLRRAACSRRGRR